MKHIVKISFGLLTLLALPKFCKVSADDDRHVTSHNVELQQLIVAYQLRQASARLDLYTTSEQLHELLALLEHYRDELKGPQDFSELYQMIQEKLNKA